MIDQNKYNRNKIQILIKISTMSKNKSDQKVGIIVYVSLFLILCICHQQTNKSVKRPSAGKWTSFNLYCLVLSVFLAKLGRFLGAC